MRFVLERLFENGQMRADLGVCTVTTCRCTEIIVWLFSSCEDQVRRTGLSNCQTLTGRREKFLLRKMASCDRNPLRRCVPFLSSCELSWCARFKRKDDFNTQHTFSSLLISVTFTQGMKDFFILNKRWRWSLFQSFSNLSAAIWNQS